VLVTRAAHQAGKLSEGLRLLGAEPVEVPVIEICPPASFEPLDAAIRQLDHQPAHYDWMIFTSANAVRVLAERAAGLGIRLVTKSATGLETGLAKTGLAWPASSKVAAVGEATAAAARKAGLKVTFVPESYVAESLVHGLIKLADQIEQIHGQRILLARAAMARDVIPDALREAGAEVTVVDAYRNVLPDAAPQKLLQALEDGIYAVTFTSSSSATHLAEAAHQAGIIWPFAGVPAVSIGPITSHTLRELGWNPTAEANPSDIPGLIAAVAHLSVSA
jgi:uroporphyrinogen-III synthase/uroporphyrinogen III methyltransferase/synthase